MSYYEHLDKRDGYLCACGHYQAGDVDCEACGAKPPWGAEEEAASHYLEQAPERAMDTDAIEHMGL